MSDGATTGIDPRFDPRYQRGYAGHEATGGAADAAEARSATAAPATAQASASDVRRVPDPPTSIPATPADVEQTEGGVERLVREFEPAESESESESRPEPAPGPAVGAPRPWLAATWALLAAFVVIGLSMIWTVGNDASYYTGMGGDAVLRELTWMSAPALVRVGLLGTVAVLTALALHRALAVPGSSQSASPVPRSRALLGLIGVIVAAIVLVIWYVSISVDGRMNGWSGAPDDEAVRLMALQSTANTLTGATVEAALWAVLALLAIVALSAVRARSARPDRR